MYILKNWYFEKKDDRYRVSGNAFGHESYQDGQWVHTSAINELVVARGMLIARTENNQYCLRFSDHQTIDQRILRRALRDYLWPDDQEVYEKMSYALRRREKKEEKMISPASFPTCALLTLSSDIPSGFKCLDIKYRNREFHSESYGIQKGMFQDYIEVSNYEWGYQFCFFAYAKNAFQLDPWSEKYPVLFIKNAGSEPISISTVYGDYAIQKDETCLISKEVSREKIFDVPVSKSSLDHTTFITHGTLKIKKL